MEELQQEKKNKTLGQFTLERKQSQISSALIKERQNKSLERVVLVFLLPWI